MALLVFEGMEGIDSHLDFFQSGDFTTVSHQDDGGADDTASMFFNSGSGQINLNGGKYPVASGTTIIIGWWFDYKSAATGGSLLSINTLDLSFGVDRAGRLFIDRWNGNRLATSAPLVVEDRSYYFEIKILKDNSAGTAECRVNGSPDPAFAETGLDTIQAGGKENFDFILFDDAGSGSDNMDNIYVCDGTGGAPFNDFLSEVHCVWKAPDGNGNVNQWTGSDADMTDNYLLVDEQPKDDDSTYVEASGLADQDLYDQPLNVSGDDILALKWEGYFRKDVSGGRSGIPLIRAGGTTYRRVTNTFAPANGSSYSHFAFIEEQNPDTATDWDDADVVEFGTEVGG